MMYKTNLPNFITVNVSQFVKVIKVVLMFLYTGALGQENSPLQNIKISIFIFQIYTYKMHQYKSIEVVIG